MIVSNTIIWLYPERHIALLYSNYQSIVIVFQLFVDCFHIKCFMGQTRPLYCWTNNIKYYDDGHYTVAKLLFDISFSEQQNPLHIKLVKPTIIMDQIAKIVEHNGLWEAVLSFNSIVLMKSPCKNIQNRIQHNNEIK